ncbi:MAG: hypothetical protein OET44_19990 [Gammaproteobacteria bacterium]|nr:hypothetical protein [Gammaproteobacteria bacterium]
MLFVAYLLVALVVLLVASIVIRGLISLVSSRRPRTFIVFQALILLVCGATAGFVAWTHVADRETFLQRCASIKAGEAVQFEHDGRIVVRGVGIRAIPQAIADNFVEVQKQAEIGGRAWRRVESETCERRDQQLLRGGHCFQRSQVAEIATLNLTTTSIGDNLSWLHRLRGREWLLEGSGHARRWTELSLWSLGSDGGREGIFSTEFCKSGPGDRNVWLRGMVGGASDT